MLPATRRLAQRILNTAVKGMLPKNPLGRESAKALFERALEIDPKAPNVHYHLGLIYIVLSIIFLGAAVVCLFKGWRAARRNNDER